MPLDPSASAPRLHRDLRALRRALVAVGQRAYATLDGRLLVEPRSHDPNAPELGESSLVVEGRPGCWSIACADHGYLCTSTTIEGVADHLTFLLRLDGGAAL